MPLPKILALDLDGTLLSPESSILTAGHARMLRAVQQRGIKIVIVTGRSVKTATPIWRQLGLNTPMICFNGAWIGYPGAAAIQPPQAIQEHMLSPRDVQHIISVLQGFSGSISACPDIHTWVMDRLCPATASWSQVYETPIEINPHLFQNWSAASYKIYYGSDPATVARAMAAIRLRFDHRFHTVKIIDDRFEINRQVNKASGLSALAQHLHLSPEQIWAAGDANNDLEMMQWPGKTFAMGHAPLAVRYAANHVLPSFTARGLCALLPHLDCAAAI